MLVLLGKPYFLFLKLGARLSQAINAFDRSHPYGAVAQCSAGRARNLEASALVHWL